MTPHELKALYEEFGSLKAVFRNTEHSWRRIQKIYRQAVRDEVMDPISPGRKGKQYEKPKGYVRETKPRVCSKPKKGRVKRYLFTSAQNNTKVWAPFWNNLMAYAEHLEAEVHVARFTYQQRSLGAHGDKKVATKEKMAEKDPFWWDDKLVSHFSDDRVQVTPGLVWCGELNVLPTAVRPLSGLQTYTGEDSTIFPHVKLAMESVPADGEAKFVYTTGTVTKRNYVQKKAGLKAEMHHCYAALLVEVDDAGRWFARQINADKSGAFYDLTTHVSKGKVHQNKRPDAVIHGDIHHAQLDPDIEKIVWGEGGVLDQLAPHYQVMHDLLDFHGPSHHAVKNPHEMFLRYKQGHLDVQKEVDGVAQFLKDSDRRFCQTVVVQSNHDQHLTRWLREQNGMKDPMNAEFWLKMNAKCLSELAEGREPLPLKDAVLDVDPDQEARFLKKDESYRLRGIELGVHGHAGPNGSRGSALSLSKAGAKMVIGHSHSACIVDGVYQVGMFGKFDQTYKEGPSSWSPTFCILHRNGKRQLVTIKGGKWRA